MFGRDMIKIFSNGLLESAHVEPTDRESYCNYPANCGYTHRFFLWGGRETGSHYVAQAGLKVMTFLPQPPESRDYKHVPTTMHGLLIFKVKNLY
jgi:hypothetical protein